MTATGNGEENDGEWETVREDEHTIEVAPAPIQSAETSSSNQHGELPQDIPAFELGARPPVDMSHLSPIGTGLTPSISWQDLAKRRSEVVSSRIRLRDSRALLQREKKRINNEEAELLPALRAASTGTDNGVLNAVIERLQTLVELRDRLRPDEEAQEQLEERLISEDAALTELESKFYSGAAASTSPSFPGGGLDFRDKITTTQDVASSSSSVFSEPPPEKQDYDLKLSEVNSIRERLMDLQSEYDQLLHEQEKRLRVGRTLDTYSLDILDRFEGDFSSLSLQLDRAEDGLMLAEANWTTRRRVLDQRDDPFVSDDPAPSSMDVTASQLLDLSLAEDNNFYENKDTSTRLSDLVDDTVSHLVTSLLRPEDESALVFRVPSSDQNGQTINMARFINQWLLQRLQQIPEEAVRFTHSLAKSHVSLDAENLPETIFSRWTQDGSEKEFLILVEAGDHSFTGSLAPHNGLSRVFDERAQSHRLGPSPQGSQRISRRHNGRLAKTEADGLN
jgi:hypothetical protein